jgi:aminoglycoside phosphotransferase (APT) family kinase protein
MNSVLTFLNQHRQRLDLARYGVQGSLSCLLLTPRFRASSHVIVLILAARQAEPLLVAKIPRLAQVTASLVREATNLQQIQARRPGGFDSIPRLVTFEPHGDRPLLIETALPGCALDPALVRTRPEHWCALVTNWLIEVHRASAAQPTEPSWLDQIEQPLRRFADQFHWTADERSLVDRTLAWLATLRRMEFPMVFAHGDLSHPNLLWMGKDQIGVLDWEMATPHGLPACDLFFFLTYVAFARQTAHTPTAALTAFQAAFWSGNAWAPTWVRTYAAALQLPVQALTPLFVVGWLRYLVGLVERLSDQAGAVEPDTAKWLRENRYYALWRHAVRHADELNWH